MRKRYHILGVLIVAAGVAPAVLAVWVLTRPPAAVDWPAWRYDAARTAGSPQQLARRLHLQWVREYPPQTPAWPEPINQDRAGFDRVYEPVVTGTTMVLGFTASDKVVALDAATGEETWRFYAEGPVRLAPAIADNNVYFTSDDGHLYCLKLADGSLMWKVRGGFDGRKILGNERLISMWPARGGPVVADRRVYFGASIWPFMGTLLYALDARSGEVRWVNDGMGSTYMRQPHNAPAFAGPAPQGHIAVAGEKLLVPNGRSVPACFDRGTGEMLYFHLARTAKSGGAMVSAVGEYFFTTRGLGADMFHLDDGARRVGRIGKLPVLTKHVYYFGGEIVTALDADSITRIDYEVEVKDYTGKLVKEPRVRWELDELWTCFVDATGALIKAGDHLYAGGRNVVSAIRLGDEPRVDWTAEVDGTVAALVAARHRLFAVTVEGRIYCFGPEKVEPVTHAFEPVGAAPAADAVARAKDILDRTGVREGYCLMYGAGAGDLPAALAGQSDLRIVAVDPDAAKVARLRRRFDDAGLYGRRIALLVGDATSLRAPPYMASLTVVADAAVAGLTGEDASATRIFRSMRPYGGVAVIPAGAAKEAKIEAEIAAGAMPGGRLVASGRDALLQRPGALPGSAEWTHQYGDVANTVCSKDSLVRAPLGLLWFGGSSHLDVLPRHGHGPPEQVVGGRLFIQGLHSVSARDVYTGRVLWKRTLPDMNTFGVYYDDTFNPDPLHRWYNQIHIPGANTRGTNFVAARDGLYVLQSRSCLKLDPATGTDVAEFRLAGVDPGGMPPTWGYLGVHDDLLIAGAEMIDFDDDLDMVEALGITKLKLKHKPYLNYDHTTSRQLVVMDRHSGDVRWTFTSRLGLRHNTIVVGGGKLFCIDMLPPAIAKAMRLRGEEPPQKPRMLALDIRTGEIVWSSEQDVFGTWLSYSAEHDALVQGGRRSGDMHWDEPRKRMIVHAGSSGAVVWEGAFRYRGPPILHGRTIYTQGDAYDLLTGAEQMRIHPLTGEELFWKFTRKYGCNTSIASVNLLTFRSGAAGYYDLTNDSGTGNFGGFKSGCTSNLVVADGVLNAPDYTRTCTCSYHNQTSLAMVHMPDVEVWSFQGYKRTNGRIRRVGLNFGAPGDRVAGGTLWLDCPSVGGQGPAPPVTFEPVEPIRFRRHSARVRAAKTPWVAASGVKGVRSIAIRLNVKTREEERLDKRGRTYIVLHVEPADRPVEPIGYTVRLHFAEPDEKAEPGRRIFHVALQGKTVLASFDVAAAAGGPLREVVREFRGVPAGDELKLTFTPVTGEAILCGVEIVAESDLAPDTRP